MIPCMPVMHGSPLATTQACRCRSLLAAHHARLRRATLITFWYPCKSPDNPENISMRTCEVTRAQVGSLALPTPVMLAAVCHACRSHLVAVAGVPSQVRTSRGCAGRHGAFPSQVCECVAGACRPAHDVPSRSAAAVSATAVRTAGSSCARQRSRRARCSPST